MNTDPERTEALRATDPDPVEALLARCLEEAEGAFEPAFQRVVAEHPEHARELERCYEALVELGMVGPRDEVGVPERIGEFRLRGRLGGGGMGVVYLAEQESLGREVALKIVRPESLYFPGARERFLREARALAGLSHPGIVPVHTVGTEGSIPYYAMERIRGLTLAALLHGVASLPPEKVRGADLHRVIAERVSGAPTAPGGEGAPARVFDAAFAGEGWRVVVRLVHQVALALAHCHAHGVLHRDVKPSNVMVTPEGRALLFDFGLARAPDALRLTRTGTEMGSLGYMAPEQFRGTPHEPDERTDVYALGVTLYEMLTSVHPFAAQGSDRTRQRILSGEVAAPRSLHPGLPWEVETVCLVAMERDPDRRYASAAAFAADLEAILAGRPIAARRPGLLVGLGRWGQRHPTATVALLLGSLLMIGGPLVYAWQAKAAEREIRGALRRVEASEEAARRDRERAMYSLRAATDAVDRMLMRVSEQDLFGQPHLEPLRRRILEDATAVYDGLLARQPEDPGLRLEAARARNRRAHLSLLLGRYDDAAQAFRAGRSRVEHLAQEPSVAARARLELLWLCIQRSHLEGQRERLDEALVAVGEGRALLASLPPAERAAARILALEARIEQQAASVLNRQDHLAEATAALRASFAAIERWRPVAEDPFLVDYHEAQTLGMDGIVASRGGDYERAGQAFRRALERWRGLAERHPDDVNVRERLWGSRLTLGRHVYAMQGPEAAMPDLEAGAAGWEELAGQFPSWLHPRCTWLTALRYLADARSDLGRDDALPTYDRALGVAGAILEASPDHVTVLEEVAWIRRRRLIWHARRREFEAAVREGEAAVAAWRRVVALRPDRVGALCELGIEIGNLASTFSRMGLRDRALERVDEAIETLEAGVLRAPDTVFYRQGLITQFVIKSELHLREGRLDDAVATAEALAALEPATPRAALRVAEVFARAVERLRREDGEAALVSRWTAKAAAAFGRALDLGVDDPASLAEHPAARILGDAPAMRELLERLGTR